MNRNKTGEIHLSFNTIEFILTECGIIVNMERKILSLYLLLCSDSITMFGDVLPETKINCYVEL